MDLENQNAPDTGWSGGGGEAGDSGSFDNNTNNVNATEFGDSGLPGTPIEAPPDTGGAFGGQTQQNAEPPVQAPVSWDTYDPAHLQDETARNLFTELRSNYQAAKPVVDWIQERGGQDFVKTDIEMVDYAWSENQEDRLKFHERFSEMSPRAYQRFMSDIAEDQAWQGLALQKAGLNPQLLDLYKQIGPDGTINGQPVLQPSVDPAVYDKIRPEFRDVFNSLPRAVQEDWALSEPEVLNWNLERAAIAQTQERAFQEQQARLEAERQQQQAYAAQERQNKVYTDIRNAVKDSVAKAFPEDANAQELILAATETTLFDSAEGKALWMEIAGLLQAGETKLAMQKIPGMIARAQVVASEKVKYLNSVFDKARRFDMMNQNVNSRREPAASNGMVNGQNGGNLARPDERGAYHPDNIMRYWQNAINAQ